MATLSSTRLSRSEVSTVRMALAIVKRRMHSGNPLNSHTVVRQYLALKYGHLNVEVFSVIWLDAQNNCIGSRGSGDWHDRPTVVYPRELVRLAHQTPRYATAVIFAHNHPSGSTDPSDADKTMTPHLS